MAVHDLRLVYHKLHKLKHLPWLLSSTDWLTLDTIWNSWIIFQFSPSPHLTSPVLTSNMCVLWNTNKKKHFLESLVHLASSSRLSALIVAYSLVEDAGRRHSDTQSNIGLAVDSVLLKDNLKQGQNNQGIVQVLHAITKEHIALLSPSSIPVKMIYLQLNEEILT